MERKRTGYTLAQLLFVVIIIGILCGMLIPVVQRSRESARQNACQNRLKKIGRGIIEHENVFERFPSAVCLGYYNNTNALYWHQNSYKYTYAPSGSLIVNKGTLVIYPTEGAYWSWASKIANYTGDEHIMDQANNIPTIGNTAWPWWQQMPDGSSLLGVVSPSYRCPTDTRDNFQSIEFGTNSSGKPNVAALSSYLAVSGRHQFQEQAGPAKVVGQNGALYVNSKVKSKEIIDGLSNTVIVGERPPGNNRLYGWLWAGKGDFPYFGTADVVLGVHERQSPDQQPDFFRPGQEDDPTDQHRNHFWSLHPSGGNWALADGSVRFLTYNADNVESGDSTDYQMTILESMASIADGDTISSEQETSETKENEK